MTQLWRLTFLTLLVGITKGQWSDNPYATCCDNYCYREDENPYLMFGTKTSYEFVYGKASNQHIVPHCRAVMFWSYNRHGTRLPSKSNIHELQQLQKIKEEIVKNYEVRGSYPESGKLCEADLEGFKRWQWNFTINDHNANALTDQGRDNIRFLARRWQTRYPELLRPPYVDQNFKFRYTDTDRTRESFEAFAQGLFSSEAYKVHGSSFANDTILNAYDNCNAWKEKTKDPEFQTEYNKFLESDGYRSLVAHVSRRLGFRYTLNETLIEAMYDMCRFDKAWMVGRPSAWCAAFTKEMLRLIEYANDLKYYYKSGYGLDMNAKLGCYPMKDMLTKFDKYINGDRSLPKAMVYFTHSAALQQLITALGVKKDSLPLSADMRQHERRQWRTSQMSPFAANLVVVLYECNREERHRVMFFLNEKPLDYPGCSVGLCSWEYIRKELQEQAENCDFEFCYHSSANFAQISSFAIFTSLIVALLKN